MYGIIPSSSTQVNLAYTPLQSLDNINHPNPKNVKKISIIHCSLSTLRGIQKFTQLESLNLKFNNLQNPTQILRISNKQILKQLNLQGNPFQLYSDCTFLALKKHGFDQLVILNNKDYIKWGKNKKKTVNMKQITQKTSQIQQSMLTTLKRALRKNQIQKYKLSYQIQPEDEATSRQSPKQPTVSISSYQRTPFKQISLSNVNLIKSIKGEKQSPQEKSKIPQLIIETIQYNNQNKGPRQPLTQPTATFASQKQRQSMPFKGRHYYASNPVTISEVDDNFTNQDQQIYESSYYPTSYTQRQSMSRTRTINNLNKSHLEDIIECADQVKKRLAQSFFLRGTYLKVMNALKPRNMPCRISYV